MVRLSEWGYCTTAISLPPPKRASPQGFTTPGGEAVRRICFGGLGAYILLTALFPNAQPVAVTYQRARAVLAAVALALFHAVVFFVPGAAAQSPEGSKRALIIAIGDYGTPPPHPVTGAPLRAYRDLNAGNDVTLLRDAD